jgi:hypothetical protein
MRTSARISDRFAAGEMPRRRRSWRSAAGRGLCPAEIEGTAADSEGIEADYEDFAADNEGFGRRY